jgi:hypothetical protein
VVVAADGPEAVQDGLPMPAMGFASDAPPVEASFSAMPSSPASSFARSASRPMASVFSIGGKPAFSTNSAVTSGITIVSATRWSSPTASSNDACVTARMSTSSRQLGATTFGRVPPSTTPTLTVTPGQRPFSSCRAIVECAA